MIKVEKQIEAKERAILKTNDKMAQEKNLIDSLKQEIKDLRMLLKKQNQAKKAMSSKTVSYKKMPRQ